MVVVSVHLPSQRQLLMVGQALNALGLELGFSQGRQKHRRENRDDGDDDQQFNEGEGASRAGFCFAQTQAAAGAGLKQRFTS